MKKASLKGLAFSNRFHLNNVFYIIPCACCKQAVTMFIPDLYSCLRQRVYSVQDLPIPLQRKP